jgi:hypothetical protein
MFSNSFGQNDFPKIYSGDPSKIFSLRKAYLNGELKNDAAIKYLKKQADKILDLTPLSVTHKEQVPPSGDKHDYMSMGKYWWPNPDTKDGLPYIRKDGEVNPEALKIDDAANVKNMIVSVVTVSIAYYITNDSKYSAKASQLLNVWFLDDLSKMNPNLNFAQFVPGRNDGRGAGIIDLHDFCLLIDAIGLLENSKEWTKENDLKIRNWFSEYLIWLQTSKNGIEESKAKNNHGSWYDVQVVAVMLFLGKNKEAKEYIENVSAKRIDSQIKEDGKQPAELARTKSLHYSAFNLEALSHLAVFGDKVGFDLWNYKGMNGGSIRIALDYILPFVLDPTEWEYKEIAEFKADEIYPILLKAKMKYDEKIYSEWIKKLYGDKIKIGIENFL